MVLSIVGAIFCFSVATLPQSPLNLMSGNHYGKKLIDSFSQRKDLAARMFVAHRDRSKLDRAIELEQQQVHRKHPQSIGTANTVTIGFYASWNLSSYNSLLAHADDLTYVMPQWLQLNKDGSGFKSVYSSETSDPLLVKTARTHDIKIIPMLFNTGPNGFEWSQLKALLINPTKHRIIAQQLREFLVSNGYSGVNIDLEPDYSDLDDSQSKEEDQIIHENMPKLVKTIKDEFKTHNLMVTQDVPPTNPCFDYSTLGDLNDLLIIMFYDQHTVSGDPGPIASQAWLEEVSEPLMKNLDPAKTILGLANFCCDWPIRINTDGTLTAAGKGTNPTIGTSLKLAKDVDAKIEMDEDDLNPYYQYVDTSGQDHIVYMLDAVTAYNQIRALNGYNLRGAALWLLGSEDPTIWAFFGENRLGKRVNMSRLKYVDFKSDVSNEYTSIGEIKEVTSLPKKGHRTFTTDADGLITTETYDVYPNPYIVGLFGNLNKAVAITFDDGPDPFYTPKILDILKKNKVPATFFVIGNEAEAHTDILAREWKQGCDIGNHTFTHPHIAEVSPVRCDLELNTTQRIIEGATGYSTRLFRPPFGDGADTDSEGPLDILVMNRTQKLGYVTVGMNLDSKDYLSISTPDSIVRRVLDALAEKKVNPPQSRNIILMHDGGGNRDKTIAALPKLITELKKRGYKLVTVSGLLGSKGKKMMFTPVSGYQVIVAGFDRLAFETQYAFGKFLGIAFLIAICLGLIRLALLTPLVLRSTRLIREQPQQQYNKPVTVLVPSYNEGKVIVRTVNSILANNYPDIKVIIIDDGSKDDTQQIVLNAYVNEPRVQYLRKENGGKSTALNLGLEHASTEVVVCIDADTVLSSDAIQKVVQPMVDPRVGAVAGNIKVGNRNTVLTMCQNLEYITCQNFDRRAYSALNTVPIVPGALGAWRKDAILAAGGYQSDTLAEDCDLTFKLLANGYKTTATNDALAFTEAPEDVKSLAKQRFRWSFGVLQVLWKHKRKLFAPRYGVFSMLILPIMWVFNVFLQILAPLVDLMVLFSLFTHQFWTIAAYGAALFVIDFGTSLLAFLMDHENPLQLSWLFWQRFFYRQFMYYVIIKSILAAVHGSLVGWGKLERKGTVSA